MTSLSRRNFLKASAATSILTISIGVTPKVLASDRDNSGNVTPCLRFTETGETYVCVPVPDMGQGMVTTAAQLIAEELDLDLNTVNVEMMAYQGHASSQGRAVEGDMLQGAGGSLSTSGIWVELRRTAAFARALFIEAASAEWGVPKHQLTIKPLPAYAGRVICWCVTLDVLKYEVIGDRSACCTEISPCPEPSAPVSFSQDRKFHLDFAGCPPLDPLHHIAYRQLWGDRDKHMDMICRQDTTDNINIQFCTHLSGKLTDTKSDFAFEDRISVFRNPDQMVPMVKNRVLALVIVHDHSPAKMKPHPAGHSF